MKTFLEIDYWMQVIIGLFLIITIPFIFIPLLLLAGLGAWQLLSSLITAVFFKKLHRHYHFPKAIGYLGLLYLVALMAEIGWVDKLPEAFIFFMGILLWFVIPVMMAVWYFNMVRNDYDAFCKEIKVKSNQLAINSPLEKEELLLSES